MTDALGSAPLEPGAIEAEAEAEARVVERAESTGTDEPDEPDEDDLARTAINAFDADQLAPSSFGIFVVGIGASAGGIEALRELLPTLPKGNVVYVIAQHMSAAHPSLLTQVLARETTMPVEEVEGGTRLRPGVIFVAPPNRDVEVKGDRFVSRQAAPRISPQPSIDVLLDSIAVAYGDHAIGVVLSGTGSDGARGMLAVKAGRGHTIVQDPANARYRDMPVATIDTGAADYVAEATEIGPLLAAIIRGETELPLRASGRWGDDPIMASIARETKRTTGWDISSYKDGTLGRQLSKRVAMLGLESTREYHDYIVENPDELVELRNSMLITVTGFLRDRKSFDTLRQTFAPIVRAKASGETVRAWVAGCATGEEAYSVAMMLADAVRERGNDVGIKVFATDISDPAMDVARRGVYHRSAIKDVPPEWRDQYFSVQGEHVQVHKHLREMLVIARQDVTVDPPLVRMDLVTCRNLLIYLVPEVQAKVLRSFHIALNPKGLLFLGRSENIPADTDLFSTVNAPSKLYTKSGSTTSSQIGFIPVPRSLAAMNPKVPLRPNRNVLTDDLRDRMLAEYAPPSVLVDATGTPVHQVGDLSRFLTLPQSGDYKLSAMIVPSLRTEISSMLEKALRDSISEVSHTLIVRFPDESMESVCVKVSRFTRAAARRTRTEDNEVFALVSFIPQNTEIVPETAPMRAERHAIATGASDELLDHVAELERELAATRQHLQSVVEELESSNEELQAMNEELQASSEELQATNEELETTNEELQATNEELTTVNETLEVRTAELSETTIVLQNIQNAVHTAIVLVDNEQRVQQFSPLAVKVFGLVSSDLGTPLTALPTTIDVVGLETRVQEVIDTGQAYMAEVSSAQATYLMQIVAYRSEAQVQGAVIALSDITELVRARTALAGISEEFRVLTAAAPVALYRTGTDLITPIEISPSIQEILGLNAYNPISDARRLNDDVHPDDRARVIELRVRDRECDYHTDYRLNPAQGSTRTIREVSRVVSNEHGDALRRVGLLFDITDLTNSEG